MNTLATEKLCECGCGNPTPIADRTRRAVGHIKGEPLRFINGHNGRGKPWSGSRIIDAPLTKTRTEFRGYETPCWTWMGKKNAQGYGTVLCSEGKRQLTAHRVVYEHFAGPIPEGLQLDHLCRNRDCVNPAHLEPVTQAENLRRGCRVKLTHADVAQIRASDLSNGYWARRFGVDVSHISRVRNRRRWR